MQVSVENTGSLSRRMTVAVPAERFEQEFSTRLKSLSRNARLPGFRPGKAPLKMVEAQLGGKLLQEVVGDLIQASYYEALNEQGLKPAGGPAIEPKAFGRGRALEYTAEFEVYPDVVRLDIKGARIERPRTAVTDADIDRTLESLRQQRRTWVRVERAAQDGDRVIIDFQGRLNGELFEGGEAKAFPLVLGSGALIGGFESGLVGASAGDQRSLTVTFPAEYRAAKLAGQTVVFDVQTNEVLGPALPEIDAEFARAFGVEDGSIERLRAEVRGNMEQEMAERIRGRVRDQVFRALVGNNPFELPRALLDAEVERLVRMERSNMASQGIPSERMPPVDTAAYEETARRRVALGLILSEIVHERKLRAQPETVRTRIQRLAEGYDQPEQFVQWHYSQPERLAEVEAMVVEDQAVDLLLEGADVVDVDISFQDLVRPAPRG